MNRQNTRRSTSAHSLSTALRLISLLLAFSCLWSFAGASLALAASPVPVSSKAKSQRPMSYWTLRAMLRNAPPQMITHSFPPPIIAAPVATPMLPAGLQARRGLRTVQDKGLRQNNVTLLDEVGHLAGPVPVAQALAWKHELLRHPVPARSALLHIWLGEWQLAANEQPLTAWRHFRTAQTLVKNTDALFGLASYDSALCLFNEGAFQDATDAFHALLVAKSPLHGFSDRNCALWLRHAAACAAYHADHSRRGIPEPPRLDPFCGIAALAASLHPLGMPSDKKTLLSVCRVTGEGSGLPDLAKASRKLGVHFTTVKADDKGLMALPKPLVAYVEQDHFVAVVGANKNGVSYLCSDCGNWPGGQVNLTWKQWHLMDTGVYGVVTKPGSLWDRSLSASLPGQTVPAIRVASRIGLGGLYLSLSSALMAAHNHVFRQVITGQFGYCDRAFSGLHCLGPYISSPMDSAGPGNNSGSRKLNAYAEGPTAGDPVNLATGEEEYSPDPDLTVYNPNGPSVVWKRVYNSLRGNGDDGSPNNTPYNSNEFGSGWSQQYNVGVYDPSITPANQPPTAQVAQGGTASFSGSGSATGAIGSGLTWVIQQDSYSLTVIASDSTSDGPGPNGWTVSTPDNGFTLVVHAPTNAPTTAASGFAYFVSANSSVNNYSVQYQAFNIVAAGGANGTITTAGNKYVYMPNGARIQFTAPSIPIASQPKVTCSVAAGFPMLVEWDYSATDQAGFYRITWPDRTQWVTNLATNYTQGSTLASLVDRNGNAITFTYANGLYGTLNTISDATSGTKLLTTTRDSYGHIASASDCYGRSVYYGDGVYYSYYTISYELTSVSQIVPTGASSPPSRYAYDYTFNHGSSTVGDGPPFLSTITTPSPTGGGMQTATIMYDDNAAVSQIKDANGNTHNYSDNTGANSNYTTVTVEDSSNNPIYTYTVGYNADMSETSRTDGTNSTFISQSTYSSTAPDRYRPVTTTDGNSNVWTYTWDSYGNMLTEMPPSNGTRTTAVTTNTYDHRYFALGELTQTQEGTNLPTPKQPTTYAYFEPSGLIQTITAPLPGTVGGTATTQTSFTYDSLGNVLTITRPGNNAVSTSTTTFNYTTDGSYSQADAIGQPVTVTDQLGEVTHLRYDGQGNTISVTDALGDITTLTYDIRNMPLTTSLPLTGNRYTYHAGSQLAYLYQMPASLATPQWPAVKLQYGPLYTTTQTAEGSRAAIRQTVNTYGPEGELVSVTGSTEPVAYTYDALYRLKTLQDAASNTTSYFYNPAGYLYQTVYPGAQTTPPTAPLTPGHADTVTFGSYDLDGNVLSRTDGNNVTTNYTYTDPESLLTGITYPTGTIGSVGYSYDAYGRRSAMTDGTGGQTYAYDDNDLLLTKNVTWTGFAAKTVSYAYYPDASRQTMTADGRAFGYTYDGVGRMTGLTNDTGDVTTYTYQPNGWLQKRSMATPAISATYTFDARGRLLDLNNSHSGTLLSDFAIPSPNGYDGVGNRLSVTATLPGAPSGYGGTTTYQYDYGQTANPQLNRSQLTGETSTRISGSQSYAYDGGSGTGPGNPTTFKGAANTFNADNQNSNTGNVYDGNGNPTTYQGNPTTYDPENRLRTYYSAYTYAYDGDGHQTSKQNSLRRVATYIYRLYDGDRLISEYNRNGSILSLSSTNTFGADGLVSRSFVSPTVTTYYTFDERGNVAQRFNSAGVLQSSDADPAFGAIDGDIWGFGGQAGYYTDTQIGLILCTYRFYDPSTGRWLNRDPMGYRGGVNLYGYVGNNPGNRKDPSGLDWALPGGGSLPSAPVMGGGAVGVGVIAVLTGPIAVIILAGGVGIIAGNDLGNQIADTIEGQDGLPAPPTNMAEQKIRDQRSHAGQKENWGRICNKAGITRKQGRQLEDDGYTTRNGFTDDEIIQFGKELKQKLDSEGGGSDDGDEE